MVTRVQVPKLWPALRRQLHITAVEMRMKITPQKSRNPPPAESDVEPWRPTLPKDLKQKVTRALVESVIIGATVGGAARFIGDYFQDKVHF